MKLTLLKLLLLALCVNKFSHTRLLAIFNGAGILPDITIVRSNVRARRNVASDERSPHTSQTVKRIKD